MNTVALLVEKRGGRSVKPYEPPGLWETGISDEQLIHDFDELMTKVIGPCANAYVSAFGELPKSEWFISMFIHLLINAIGCTGPDGGMEPAARLTPAF